MTLTQEEIDALPSRYVHKKSHLPYDMAKKAVASLAPHVTSAGKYRKWRKDTKSYYMPAHPELIYPKFSWSDFLDSDVKSFIETVANRRELYKNLRPMWDAVKWAQKYCHLHDITTFAQWIEHYKKTSDIPNDIPMYPQHAYKDSNFPGYPVWLGKNASAVQEAAKRVTPVLTLLHPVKMAQNVVQLVSWSEGIGDLRSKWRNQSDFDRIIGCWVLEREQLPEINRIMEENGFCNGEQWTIPNLNQLTWELNSILDMVKMIG